MAGIGHVAVGVAVGRAFVSIQKMQIKRAGSSKSEGSEISATKIHSISYLTLCMVLGVAFSMLPDADVIAFSLKIPYHAPWGHRGASHSMVFACLLGLFVGAIVKAMNRPHLSAVRVGLFATLTLASHGLLDTLTNGGLGVALLWPFSNVRLFAPWRPLPVSPLGWNVLSPRGFRVITTELLFFIPFFLYAFWPRKK